MNRDKFKKKYWLIGLVVVCKYIGKFVFKLVVYIIMLDCKIVDWKIDEVIDYKMCILNVLKLLKFIDCSIVMKLFVGGKLLVIFYLCVV